MVQVLKALISIFYSVSVSWERNRIMQHKKVPCDESFFFILSRRKAFASLFPGCSLSITVMAALQAREFLSAADGYLSLHQHNHNHSQSLITTISNYCTPSWKSRRHPLATGTFPSFMNQQVTEFNRTLNKQVGVLMGNYAMTELKCCLSRAHMAAETVPLFINVLSFLYVVCTKLPDQKCYILS